LTDAAGRPLALVLTAGNRHDLEGAEALLAITGAPARLLADRAYDARRLRDRLADSGTIAVIPPNPTRKHPHPWDPLAYKARNSVERFFCRLKDFRRIATRYDKRADTYLSGAFLAAAITCWTN
jgi:transposase